MTLLQRIASLDKSAVSECIEHYGDFVWSVSRKCTSTVKEAEAYSQQIFSYIWKNAGKFDLDKQTEEEYISHLTLKWIMKNGLQGQIAFNS